MTLIANLVSSHRRSNCGLRPGPAAWPFAPRSPDRSLKSISFAPVFPPFEPRARGGDGTAQDAVSDFAASSPWCILFPRKTGESTEYPMPDLENYMHVFFLDAQGRMELGSAPDNKIDYFTVSGSLETCRVSGTKNGSTD
jgi:hypothetical protein